MPVCSIIKPIIPRCRGAVDDLMHYCTEPKAECNSLSGRPRYRGVIVWLYYKQAWNNCFITQTIWWNTYHRSLNGVAVDYAVLLQKGVIGVKICQTLHHFHHCCITSPFINEKYAHRPRVDKRLCVFNREAGNQAMVSCQSSLVELIAWSTVQWLMT